MKGEENGNGQRSHHETAYKNKQADIGKGVQQSL
jgi:hypothetical protein